MKVSKQQYSRYLLPKNMTKALFVESLQKNFIINETDKINEEISILDSFEWGLYFRKLVAIQYKNNDISIWNEDSLLDPESARKLEKINAKAKFWWDFPDSPTKELLKEILDLRALYPVYQGYMQVSQFNLEDENGKILAFCQLTSIFDSKKSTSSVMCQAKLVPVTGYKSENKQAIEIIESLGGFEPKLSPLDSLLGAIGVIPQEYSSKPNLKLSGSISGRDAASSIVAIMIEKQRQTEEGIIKDIDSEFLHDFRVSLRMIRAAIAQLKDVFPEYDANMLKERFGNLARETNKLRDLDVFIIEKERYINLLPNSLRKGLLPMFKDFEKSRVAEVKRVSAWLSGSDYQQEMDDLESLFVNGYSTLETEWSEKPSIELAVKKIQKRYKTIQYAAINITQDTPDSDIHSIRIDCKKLRYLLYFFDNLFDKNQVKIAGAHLKSLQSKLGNFNDFSVQGEFLENYLYAIEHKPKKDILLIAALGGLIASLHTMQLQERDKCIAELAIFSNAENQKLFKETFILNQ